MRILDESALQRIGAGAALLGSGGGGNAKIGVKMAQKAIQEYGTVQFVSLDELPDDGIIVSCAMIGDPSRLQPKHIPDGTGLETAFRAIEQHLKRPITAIMPAEGAGANVMMAVVLAARVRLPVVDADSMGRAFPELSMRTFCLHGLWPQPAVLGTEQGKVTILYPHDAVTYEAVARTIVGRQEDGFLALVDYPMEVHTIRRTGILGTITKAEQYGSALLAGHLPKEAKELFVGTVRSVNHNPHNTAFHVGQAIIQSEESVLSLSFQNEFLEAQTSNSLITAPTIINALDPQLNPISTHELKEGQTVSIITLPAPRQWLEDGS